MGYLELKKRKNLWKSYLGLIQSESLCLSSYCFPQTVVTSKGTYISKIQKPKQNPKIWLCLIKVKLLSYVVIKIISWHLYVHMYRFINMYRFIHLMSSTDLKHFENGKYICTDLYIWLSFASCIIKTQIYKYASCRIMC